MAYLHVRGAPQGPEHDAENSLRHILRAYCILG